MSCWVACGLEGASKGSRNGWCYSLTACSSAFALRLDVFGEVGIDGFWKFGWRRCLCRGPASSEISVESLNEAVQGAKHS